MLISEPSFDRIVKPSGTREWNETECHVRPEVKQPICIDQNIMHSTRTQLTDSFLMFRIRLKNIKFFCEFEHIDFEWIFQRSHVEPYRLRFSKILQGSHLITKLLQGYHLISKI